MDKLLAVCRRETLRTRLRARTGDLHAPPGGTKCDLIACQTLATAAGHCAKINPRALAPTLKVPA
jgi:hypothetical protein